MIHTFGCGSGDSNPNLFRSVQFRTLYFPLAVQQQHMTEYNIVKYIMWQNGFRRVAYKHVQMDIHTVYAHCLIFMV